MRIVCGCLNIKVEVQNFLDLEVLELDLSPEEKCHPYFMKDVYKMTGKVSGISEAYTRLVKSEIVGSWNICQCLICKIYTHGTNYVNGLATCSSALKEEPADLKTFGRDRNISYSQVFQVCFPSHLDVTEDFLSHLPRCDIVDGDTIKKIGKQANSFLEMAEKKMKANAKTPVEKQLQAMEALKRRVKCEERYLHLLILQSKNDIMRENVTSNVSKPSHLQFQPNPCSTESDRSFPYYTEPQTSLEKLPQNKIDEETESETNLRTFSLSLNCNDIQEELQKLHLNSQPDIGPQGLEERSSDAEGIFEMDDDHSSALTISNVIPEQEEEESDEDDPHDFSEEFRERSHHVPRDFARSVPLDVPVWPSAIGRQERGVDTKRPKDPQEMAASMRELARSVRMSSEDVFGDLPRSKLLHKYEFAP